MTVAPQQRPPRSAAILGDANHRAALALAAELMPSFMGEGVEFAAVVGHVIALFALSRFPEATSPQTSSALSALANKILKHADSAYVTMLTGAMARKSSRDAGP